MHFDVAQSTIFLTVTGSHAYGMSTPESDVDVRGICVANADVRLSYMKQFDQYQGALGHGHCDLLREKFNWGDKPDEAFVDTTIYDLAKAIKLIADNNPNMIELLWAPEERIVLAHPSWLKFVQIRDSFLSQKCKYTFMGYAHAQYRKIASHRSWLLDPPKGKPERTDFGLPETSLLSADDRNRIEEAVAGIVRSWQIEDILHGAEQDMLRERMVDFWSSFEGNKNARNEDLDDQMKTIAGREAGLSEGTLILLSRERRYRASLKHWNSYLKWKNERNPKRAELEARHGFDTKHASHLVRLARMCVEILTFGEVRVQREDAEELLAIRRGARTFEDIEAEFNSLKIQIEGVVSKLPHSPNHALIDSTLIEVLREHL